MPNVYKTAQGILINMDNLRLVNEKTRAVGNVPVNARGDSVDRDGSVLKTKQDQLRERNQKLENLAKYQPKKNRG